MIEKTTRPNGIAISGPKHATGFTLMELMIVVAIVGILAALVYPSYTESVRKSRRSEAKTALSDLAARQEQYMTNNKTYASTLAQLGIVTATTPGGWYTLSAPTATTTIGTTITAYTLTAAPNNDQTRDTKCGSLTLTSTGVKGATGSLGRDCW